MPSSKQGQASITVRCTIEQKKAIEKKWKSLGFDTEAQYIRFVALNAEITVKAPREEDYIKAHCKTAKEIKEYFDKKADIQRDIAKMIEDELNSTSK